MPSYWTTTTGWAPSRRCRVTLRCGPWSGITVSPTRRFSAVTVLTQYVMVAAFLPGGVGSQGSWRAKLCVHDRRRWQARGNANPDGQWTHATPIDQDKCDPISVNRPQDRRSGRRGGESVSASRLVSIYELGLQTHCRIEFLSNNFRGAICKRRPPDVRLI